MVASQILQIMALLNGYIWSWLLEVVWVLALLPDEDLMFLYGTWVRTLETLDYWLMMYSHHDYFQLFVLHCSLEQMAPAGIRTHIRST
jgi:hypothetical protein